MIWQVALTDDRSALQAKLHENEAELSRSRTTQARLSQVLIYLLLCMYDGNHVILVLMVQPTLSEINAYFEQEKELTEKHNTWLNEELTSKVDTILQQRQASAEVEADLSAKLADVSFIHRCV